MLPLLGIVDFSGGRCAKSVKNTAILVARSETLGFVMSMMQRHPWKFC
jgi:hypothetical protein